MPTFNADLLRDLTTTLFEAVATPPTSAAFIADSLVASVLAAHASHRVIRCPQYLEVVRLGFIDPSRFTPLTEFREAAGEEAARVRSSVQAEGFSEVLMPGDLEIGERRRQEVEGSYIEPSTWESLLSEARRYELSASIWATEA